MASLYACSKLEIKICQGGQKSAKAKKCKLQNSKCEERLSSHFEFCSLHFAVCIIFCLALHAGSLIGGDPEAGADVTRQRRGAGPGRRPAVQRVAVPRPAADHPGFPALRPLRV